MPRFCTSPVGRRRAFVEFGQFLDVLGGADQQIVDAGPGRCAVALAARRALVASTKRPFASSQKRPTLLRERCRSCRNIVPLARR
jgi:hypothetical protein